MGKGPEAAAAGPGELLDFRAIDGLQDGEEARPTLRAFVLAAAMQTL